MKKFLVFLVVAVLLGTGGFFAYRWYEQNQAAPVSADVQNNWTEYTVARGSLSKSVTGTGTLDIARTEDIRLDYAVKVTETLVEAGDTVTTGQPLMRIDTAALQTLIDTLQTEMDTTESDIASAANSYDITRTLTMPLYGRVKELYLEEGRYIEDVLAEHGCIALLSLDGRMMAEITAPRGLEIGDTVRVTVEGNKVTGTVRDLVNGMAQISFTDAYGEAEEEVTIVWDGDVIGEAVAQIHMPYELVMDAQGYIDTVYLQQNGRRYTGGTICLLQGVPVSASFRALEETRERQLSQLAEMKKLVASGTINAAFDGIVSSIVESAAEEQAASTVLASLYVGDEKEMVVSVDELDIISVQAGQNVSIAMDAIEDKTYSATVSKVSPIGTATSGVTVYDVTLAVDGDENLRFGMNGTATIHVEERDGVLLVPLTALNSSRGQSYVWLKNGEGEGDEPGVRRTVSTGLSDDTYVEITEGLDEGDVVLITREAASSETGTRMNFGGMMNMGSMPSMPSGGGPGGSGGGQRRGN